MFKVGDTIICREGIKDGGAGYQAGRIFVIDTISGNGDKDTDVLWPGPNMSGVYARAAKLHKEKEEQQTINNNYSIF